MIPTPPTRTTPDRRHGYGTIRYGAGDDREVELFYVPTSGSAPGIVSHEAALRTELLGWAANAPRTAISGSLAKATKVRLLDLFDSDVLAASVAKLAVVERATHGGIAVPTSVAPDVPGQVEHVAQLVASLDFDFATDIETLEEEEYPSLSSEEVNTLEAQLVLASARDRGVRDRAWELLDSLRAAMGDYWRDGVTLVEASTDDDGSAFIEWTSDHWRIGFIIRPVGRQSTWYIVADHIHDNYHAWANLDSVSILELVKWAEQHRD